MRTLPAPLESVDVRITRWMARYGITTLRVAVGVVFVWFGVLKYFPGLSPAQELALRTTDVLTFGLIAPSVSLVALATLECAIGLGLVFGKGLRLILLLLAFQMVGAVSPLFLFPEVAFTRVPYAPTLEGQYIIKNIVLVSAGLVVGATVRGGHLVSDAGAPREEPRPEEQRARQDRGPRG